MNTKTLLALAALTVVGTASAVVTSANTLCRIEVNSGTKSTIIAVPLVKVGDGSGIPANQLVLTDNLNVGDTILHWNGTTWDAWVVAENEETHAKYWNPTVISEGSKNSTSAPAEGTALACGEAIWVNRTSQGADLTKPFFIYGQVAATTAKMPKITRASGAPTYIMMGNTALADVAITALPLNGTPAEGDKIAVSATTGLGVKEYTWKDGAWKEATLGLVEGVLKPTVKTTEDTIPAGQGFWYIAQAQAVQ